ncbi:type VI secretion system membrane subunit TssM [Thaumasiovibrio subtropicus]|uniref:type VI secretion system membrane subunit TssM n=1 Tax=Thaumasiovibrio subtropicus TaxID=1891207 RepID=UPI000B35510B|nr:type VI secretion system membrane subunit TssM [Thaumasiovibrio subtropicus]
MNKNSWISLTFLLFVIALCVVAWQLPNDETYQFARRLCLIIAGLLSLLWVVFLVMQWRKSRQVQEDNEQQVLLKQDAKIIELLFKEAVKKIQGSKHNRLRTLYDLPWYLVMGGEQDAKSSLLHQNNLEPLLSSRLDSAETDQYLRFWSGDHAVVIEVGHRIFDNDGVDEQLWKVLAKQLMKYRPRQALTGVMPVIGCHRLLEGDKKRRQQLANGLQEAILSLDSLIGLQLPVYPVFSKADAITDFVAFFNAFSGADIDNPFGITLSCDAQRRFDPHQFEDQAKALLKQLVEQQFELLRNIDERQAAAVIALPYQLRIFLERVKELLTDIGRENRVREAVWIRGAYLLSAGQKGNEYDLLTQVIAEKAEFNTYSQSEQLPGRRAYFAPRFLSHVVLPEVSITGINQVRNARYLFGRAASLVVGLTILTLVGVAFKENWNKDEAWRADASTQLTVYESDIKRLESAPHTISDTIAVLSELRAVANSGMQPVPWYQQVSIKQPDTAEEIYHIYEEQLHQFLLPRVENLISSELYVYIRLGNPSKIFEILRYYQMLFDRQRLDSPQLIEYLLGSLRDQGDVSISEIENLNALLMDLFNSRYDHALTANQDLIAVAGNNLEGLSPERLIYARLKSLPTYRVQIDIRSQLGEKFNTVFSFSDGFNGYLMPVIYTKQGYDLLDLSPTSQLLREQLNEFKAIQGDLSAPSVTELTDLSKQIQRLYFADYIYRWRDLVNNIQVRRFGTTTDLAYALRMAREPASSPILDVLEAVVQNTSLAVEQEGDLKEEQQVATALGLGGAAKTLKTADKLNNLAGDKLLMLQPSYVVNEAFVAYGSYVNGTGQAGSPTPLSELLTALDELNTYFDAALSGANPAQSMHTYAVAHAEGSQDAIVLLGRQAGKAPSRVATWIYDLQRQSWRTVIGSSISYLNQQWNQRVYQFYYQAVEGRFPFDLDGRGEVAIDDFSVFFKPNGYLDTFVDEMLKPFVYWDNNTLRLNEVDGATLPIQSSTLTQINNARAIRSLFFGLSGQELSLNLSIRPSSMSTDVTEFQMREAESVFTYKHGPRVWREVSWPSIGVDGYLSTQFYQTENRVAERTYSGQWALFRALFDGESSGTNNRAVRKLNYQLDSYNIVLDYTLQSSSVPLTKTVFTRFNLPKTL